MEYIYLLQNTKTKRIYVGRTKHPEWRFKQHMSALRGHRHKNEIMQNDFDLFGQQSFKFRIVESSEHLTRSGVEGDWMIRLKTYDKKYGYNYKDQNVIHWNGAIPQKVIDSYNQPRECAFD